MAYQMQCTEQHVLSERRTEDKKVELFFCCYVLALGSKVVEINLLKLIVVDILTSYSIFLKLSLTL